jgi:hypothetical protein
MNALNLIPNGVLMINLHSMNIDFANQELYELVRTPLEEQGQKLSSFKALRVRLSKYFSSHAVAAGTNKEKDSTARLSSSSTEREHNGSSINLWEYLSRLEELTNAPELKTENVFKLAKPDKRYIQVKT